MNVLDLVCNYLKENGYDGIYNSEGECACSLEDGLMPCGECFSMCKPGYKATYEQLTEEQKQYSDGACDWFIVKDKP